MLRNLWLYIFPIKLVLRFLKKHIPPRYIRIEDNVFKCWSVDDQHTIIEHQHSISRMRGNED